MWGSQNESISLSSLKQQVRLHAVFNFFMLAMTLHTSCTCSQDGIAVQHQDLMQLDEADTAFEMSGVAMVVIVMIVAMGGRNRTLIVDDANSVLAR